MQQASITNNETVVIYENVCSTTTATFTLHHSSVNTNSQRTAHRELTE